MSSMNRCSEGQEKTAPFDLEAEIAVLRDFREEYVGTSVGVVYGPKSEEDRYYLERAPRSQLGVTALLEALTSLGFRAVQIDPTALSFITDLHDSELLFLNLHGEFGEDGRVQGLLDYLGRQYTGSGVLASALCLDKVMFKRVISSVRIPTPRFVTLTSGSEAEALSELAFPVIVKPVTGGSSLGTHLLWDQAAAREFFVSERTGRGPLFAEEFISGRSVTVGVLELDRSIVAAPPVEVVCDAEFYDATTKLDEHSKGLAQYRVTSLPAAVDEVLRSTALRIHSLVGCRGFSRVDFVLGNDSTVYTLEVTRLLHFRLRAGYRWVVGEHGCRRGGGTVGVSCGS